MFHDACAIAREFTRPFILSRLTVAGECSSSVGAYVVVNKEGWVVTAWHILEQLDRMNSEEATARKHEAERAKISANASLSGKEKGKALGGLGKLANTSTRRCSAWFGQDGLALVDIRANPAGDVAVGRLEPFDPASIKRYPVFKDPSKGFEQGISLCKLGYPFAAVETRWDATKDAFILPSLMLTYFPLEGMFTRTAQAETPPNAPPPYPILFVETSTPGLRGQSGGPTFDARGTIWAIQSRTMHLPLGFSPEVKGVSGKPTKEHQFLNTGLGTHPTTIFGLFKEAGVSFEMSDY